MNLYVLDLDGRAVVRHWSDMLEMRFIRLQFDFRDAPKRFVRDDGQEVKRANQSRDLLLVHWAGGRPSEAQCNLVVSFGAPIVVISGSPNQRPLPNLPASETCYYRQAPVLTRQQGTDGVFGRLVKRFWDNYQDSGRPCWRKLEPDSSPESLLAVVLAVRAMTRYADEADAGKRKRIATAMPKQLIDRAKAEFDKRGYDGWDGRLPDSVNEVEALDKCLRRVLVK